MDFTQEPHPGSPAILVENVFKRYRGRRGVEALRGVSLAIQPGEIFGLLGRNGAGKTTLVKILLDIVRPTQGRTSLLGQSSRSAATRRPVGYLPEDHRFPDYRTGESTMQFYAMLSGLGPEERATRIPELLALVDLTEASRQKMRGYSKGMKQRLGLAQALVHDPQVIFLDEPTDGVDPIGRAHIRDVLLKLKAQGKTIFINSHLLGEVEQVCDRVAIMEQGLIVEQGVISDLTSSEGQHRITTVPGADAQILESLAQFASNVSASDGVLELTLPCTEDIDRVVDLLRAKHISIRSIEGKKNTLEQVFLEAVDSANGSGEEEAR